MAGYRKSATTIEDFQRIFYFAGRNLKLSQWAETNWDALSKQEVDAATTLEEAKQAHSRSFYIDAYGLCAAYGNRKAVAQEYAATKWDALALEAIKKITSGEDTHEVLLLTRE